MVKTITDRSCFTAWPTLHGSYEATARLRRSSGPIGAVRDRVSMSRLPVAAAASSAAGDVARLLQSIHGVAAGRASNMPS